MTSRCLKAFTADLFEINTTQTYSVSLGIDKGELCKSSRRQVKDTPTDNQQTRRSINEYSLSRVITLANRT